MKKEYVIDQSRGPHIRDYSDQSQNRVIIYSSTGYWAANGCGYTTRERAGVYTRDDAYKRAGHCGPEKGCEFHDVPADHVPTLQAKLSEAHRVIMAKCCPGPENWPDSKEWWQVAADRIDTLTGVLRAGKEDRWAATHGSDECGFEPTDWVIAAEKILAGEDHVPTLQAEVERLNEVVQSLLQEEISVDALRRDWADAKALAKHYLGSENIHHHKPAHAIRHIWGRLVEVEADVKLLREALQEAACWLPDGTRTTPRDRGAKCETFSEAREIISIALTATAPKGEQG